MSTPHSTTPRTTGTAPARRGPSAGRVLFDRLVIVVMLVGAAAFSLYPLAAMYVNDRNAFEAGQAAGVTQAHQASADPALAQEMFEAAHAYNEQLSPTVLADPIFGDDPSEGEAYQEYLQTMGGAFTPMGTIVIPTIDTTLPVFHGTSESVLNKGAGHMYGSDLPVGGEGTRSVISAHRGLPSLSAFDRLPEVQIGDMFYVKTYGETLAYEVTELDTVLPNDMESVMARDGEDLMTLVTCTPYAVNTHRLLVTGERVPFEDLPAAVQADADPTFSFTLPPGSWLRVAIAGVSALVIVFLIGRWLTTDLLLPALARRRNTANSSTETKTSTRPAPPVKESTMNPMPTFPRVAEGA